MHINGIENVAIMPFAVSDQYGEAIFRMAGNPAMASLIWHRDKPASEIVVKTFPFDGLVSEGAIPPPSFVKIDVEGCPKIFTSAKASMFYKVPTTW